jgi:alpha-1,6-mannosyltransferase
MRLVAVCLVTVAASLAFPALHAQLGFKSFNIVYALQFALYLLAVVHVRRASPARVGERTAAQTAQRELLVILVGALAMRLALVWQAPFLSDDVFRYVWDGKVQAAGINPYRYIPEAPELAGLRDADIFTNINRRAYAPTIYPPAAQIMFLAAYFLGGGTVFGMKLVLVACDVATIAILVRLLRRFGEDPRRVLVYAWHPLACWEVAHSGHLDAVAIALIAGTFLAAHNSKRGLAGMLLGVATLVKGYPLLLAPALLRRGGLRFAAAFAAAFLLYIPYAGVGARVLGFLPMYVREEGIASGDRFVLLRVMRLVAPVPAWLYIAGVVLTFGLVSLRTLRRRSPTTPLEARDAATLAALALALGTPHYAWYAVWLVALVAIAPRPAWFYLACAFAMQYYEPRSSGARLAFMAVQFIPLAVLLGVEARDRGGSASTILTTTESPPGPS